MSFDFSALKWGSIIAGVLVGLLVAILLNILVQVGSVVVLGFQMRGTPPPDAQAALLTGLPLQLVAVLLALLGGIVGGRFAGRRSEEAPILAGLVVGIVLAILVAGWRAFSFGGFDLWVVLLAIAALVGGWLGGWLAQRRAARELEAT